MPGFYGSRVGGPLDCDFLPVQEQSSLHTHFTRHPGGATRWFIFVVVVVVGVISEPHRDRRTWGCDHRLIDWLICKLIGGRGREKAHEIGQERIHERERERYGQTVEASSLPGYSHPGSRENAHCPRYRKERFRQPQTEKGWIYNCIPHKGILGYYLTSVGCRMNILLYVFNLCFFFPFQLKNKDENRKQVDDVKFFILIILVVLYSI